jgi:hypothetical protein
MIRKYRTNQNLVDTGFNQTSGQTLSLSGNTLIANSATFRYDTNQHSRYVARSIVDAEYVTGLTVNIRHIGSNQQVIYHDVSGITGATGFIYNKATSGVTVPNLHISQAPAIQVGNYYILTWDSGTTKVNKIPALCVTGIQGAVNGLGVVGDCVCLGGLLTNDTIICGSDSYSLSLKNLCNVCIITTANNIVLDSRCCSGGIYLKSQSGTISSPVINYTNSVGIAMDYPSDVFKVYDNRIGVSQRGIEYAGDYSAFYTARSLVDKNYVDAVASGLSPHPAVDAATSGITDNRILSGLTGMTIIDGITINIGDRVLIKNQTDAKRNGIYVLTGTTGNTYFVRATDFDESSESIHGAYTFVISGITNGSSSWVLSTPNPILINVTPLTFTLFSQVTDIIAGTGITISKYYGQNTISVNGPSLAGNSLTWNNSTCKFDVIGGGTITGATNVGAGTTVYSGTSGQTLVFNTFVGSGGTVVQKVGDEIIICSNTASGSQAYSGQTPSAVNLCGITIGYQLTGKTVSCILQDLLVPELCGTVTAPSTSISLSATGTYEVGCVLSETVCGIFSRGSISPQYCSLSPFRSGCANAYCFTGTGMPAGWQACVLTPGCRTNASYTIILGSQSWGVCTRYNCGCPALSNKNNQYCAALVSGNTSAASANITGIYPYYYGKLTCGIRPPVSNSLVTGGTKVVAISTGTVIVTFNSSASEYTWLAIPQISTSKGCWYVNALDNGKINTSPSDKYPDECIIAITSAQGCWASINYKVYMSGAVGAISAPMEFRV